jgi:hypothetical protein
MAPDHDALISRYLAGARDATLLKELGAVLADDAELRAELRDELALDRMARTLAWSPLDPGGVMEAIAAKRSATLERQVMAQIGGAAAASRRSWRWGATAAALLVATFAAMGVAASQRPPTPAIFASLHPLAGVRWTSTLVAAAGEHTRLGAGMIDLAAGRAEIAFDNGARLLLEGPARAELLAPLRIRLHHGRLTTDIPPAAHGFTVVTTGLQVVDLGTEVGIEAARDGRTAVQVYQGAVDLVLPAHPTADAVHLVAGMARRVDAAAGRIEEAAFEPGRFARLASGQALTLDVADLIGGGDGRGSATDEGIDPALGLLASGPSRGTVRGDGAFHALPGHPFLDGTFVPRGGGSTIISTTGLSARFALAGGATYDLIRRGGFMIRPPDSGYKVMSRSPSIIGGIDHAGLGHSLVGIHTNAGVTFDLRAIAQEHGRVPVRFSTVVANTAPRHAAPALSTARGAFEALGAADGTRWTPLEVRQAAAASGTVLTLRPDGSVLASAPAATDSYTVTCMTGLGRLTALKLEVLPDPSLPANGPGANGNGNFVLTRLRVGLMSGRERHALDPIGAVADFSQSGWPIAAAVIGTGPTGWGVVPETGRAHTAVFFLDHTPVPSGARVVVTLDQLCAEWDHHLIGRFRLSATDDPDPARGLVVGAGSFLVLVDGELAQRVVVPQADQTPARIEVPLSPSNRFLTLVSSDGGYGNGCQWTTMGDPRLHLAETGPQR